VFDVTTVDNITDAYLFNYQVGGQMPMTNQRATYADTNMPGSGQLPMGHQMLVYSLQVIPDEFAVVANNVAQPLRLDPEWFVRNAFWKWRKVFHQTMLHLVVEQTKSFVEGRLDHFPAGGGFTLDHNCATDEIAGAHALNAGAGYDIGNGLKTWAATRRLAMPVHLGSLENFYVTLDWPRGGLGRTVDSFHFDKGFGIMIRLTGPRQRPTA
jgi:hypothetical protein